MKNILALTKRNCLLFVRNKATFFFSLFSSLILIVLYFLFIAKLYSQGFNETAGLELSKNQINALIYTQMIMGVLVINSVSLSTSMFSIMAYDIEKGKTESFLITKLKGWQLLFSYLISAIIISFLINLLMFIISTIIIGIVTGFWLGAGAFFLVVCVMILTTLVSCAIMLLITTIARSSSAIGVINGIVGTVIGFLCGIYMPYSNLGTGAKYLASFIPFTHLTIWLKQIVLGNAFYQFAVPEEISSQMSDLWFSAGNIGFCGLNVPLWAMILLSCLFAVGCFILAYFLLRKRILTKKVKVKKIKKEA